MKNLDIAWNGRLRIDEPSISEEQHNTFFAKDEYTISLRMANVILADIERDGIENTEEIVPADQLSEVFLHELIADVISEAGCGNDLRGTLVAENGQKLNWSWDLLELNVSSAVYDDNGDCLLGDYEPVEMTFSELPLEAQEHILRTMLIDGCHSGMFDCDSED